MKEFLAGLILTLVVGEVSIAIEQKEKERNTSMPIAIEMFLAGAACGMEILGLFKRK